MADVNIGAKITVDTGNSQKSINDINKEIKDASAALKEAKIGSDEYTAAQERLKKAQGELSASTKEKVGTFGQLKEQLKGTVPALDSASSGVAGLGKQFLALLANPIVLLITGIVVALKGLYSAFTNTIPGAQKVEQIFTGLKAVVTVLVDRMTTFGNAIIKLFSGDFKGAAEAFKTSFDGVGKQLADTYNNATEIQKRLQKIREEERADARDKANRLARLASLKEQLNDESIALSERKRIAAELKRDAEQNAKDDLRREKEKSQAQIDLINLKTNKSEEDLDKINELQINIDKTAREGSMENFRINRQIRALDKQEKAQETEEAKKRAEEEKQRLDNIREYKNKILKLQQEQSLAVEEDAYKKERMQLQNSLQDQLRDINLSFEQKKITRQQANDLIEQETKLFNLKLRELDKKHTADEIAEQKKKDDAKIAQMRAQEEKIKAFQEEETKMQIKARTDTIKLQDSELSLAKAKQVATIQLERETFEIKRQLERANLEANKASGAELTAFDNETTAQRIALNKAETEVKMQNLQTVGNAIGSVGQLIGEQTVAGKGLAIAQATINTYEGATKALAQGGIFGSIAAAGVIASGLASIKKIVSVQVPGASGDSSAAGGGISAPAVPAPIQPKSGTTVLDQSTVSQIGNAAVKAYVVESDVRNNRERITRLNRAARLG